MSDNLKVPVLAIRNAVLFPGSVAPFDVGRDKSVALVEALAIGDTIAVYAQLDPATDDPGEDDLHAVGTLAKVVKALRHANGNYSLILQGTGRCRLRRLTQKAPYLVGTVEELPDRNGGDPEAEALGLSLRDTAKEVLSLMPELPRDVHTLLSSITDFGTFADVAVANMDLSVAEKIAVLELDDVKERIRHVVGILTRHLEVMRMRERINNQIKEEMGKNQREYVLRQQLKAIREELGDDDDDQGDLDNVSERILKANLPKEASDVAKKQLKRLRSMQQGSSEYTVTRTYLDWILDLPWNQKTIDNLDIADVRRCLDEDHYGLEKVKKRILEYLAVRKLRDDKKGPILCLAGPPGVGKTSLGRSIAKAMGRKFHRISLGGVHDEAAIRGHRRTYVGAIPGQIIHGAKKVGTTNPVFMLDEIDKLGRDNRGDPSAALLEVLDPEQNNTFADHYLEIPYDLSGVLWVATANQLDTIPGPLRDRMEIIEIPGYTRQEKLAIAKSHLIGKQLREHGLRDDQVTIGDEALEAILEGYTREAGVRSLERQIAGVVRGVAVEIAEGTIETKAITSPEDVAKYLGPKRFSRESGGKPLEAGIATGLAWTAVGGDILFIEATRMPGTGKLQLTGQLGDVMKESVHTALSFVRANADKFGITDPSVFEKSDIHVHVPAGATPKDGPSAGITMVTALVSLLSGRPVRHDVGMTGEVSLRGRVLPIGGLKEKVLAAHRAGLRCIILPEANRADIEEIPAEIRAELEFVPLERVEDVLEKALTK